MRGTRTRWGKMFLTQQDLSADSPPDTGDTFKQEQERLVEELRAEWESTI